MTAGLVGLWRFACPANRERLNFGILQLGPSDSFPEGGDNKPNKKRIIAALMYVYLHIHQGCLSVNLSFCSLLRSFSAHDLAGAIGPDYSLTIMQRSKSTNKDEGSIPRVKEHREELLKAVQEKVLNLNLAVRQLVQARVELELYDYTTGKELPDWIFPEATKRLSIAELIHRGLYGRAPAGLKLKEIVVEITRAGRKPKVSSISATLGRMKREGKVERGPGGYWRLVRSAEDAKKTEE